MRRIELHRAVAVGIAPGVGHVEELPDRKSLVGGRLDVDDVLLRRVDVQPVVALDVARGIHLDARVVAQIRHGAVVDDLQRGVVMELRML